MKKLFITLMVLGVAAIANAETFPISASIPAATTVQFKVNKVTLNAAGDIDSFVEQTGSTALNFNVGSTNALKYDSANNIWTSDHFFAIDLSPAALVEGVLTPAPGTYNSVTFAYSANSVPTGQPAGEGLNKRGTLAASRVQINPLTLAEEEIPVITPRSLGGTLPSLTNADIVGGYLRVYVGLSTGELVGGVPVAAGSVPFSNADKPGNYGGTLTITATLI